MDPLSFVCEMERQAQPTGADRGYKARFIASDRRCSRQKACILALSFFREETVAEAPTGHEEEVVRLREINRCLRTGVPMELPPWDDKPPVKRDGDLMAAQLEIQALDVEISRLHHQRFEDDERMREYEAQMACLLKSPAAQSLPGRFYPVPDCGSEICAQYVRRLRDGVRHATADAYLRERRVRINGHFRLHVRPLERLRAEKDAEIAHLRRRMKQLECAAFLTVEQAADMSTLNNEWVERAADIERLKSEAEELEGQCEELRFSRDSLEASVQSLRSEAEEARQVIEAAQETRTLGRAELAAVEKEREAVQAIWDRIDRFMKGTMALEYNQKRLELERLEASLAALRTEDPPDEEPEEEPIEHLSKRSKGI